MTTGCAIGLVTVLARASAIIDWPAAFFFLRGLAGFKKRPQAASSDCQTAIERHHQTLRLVQLPCSSRAAPFPPPPHPPSPLSRPSSALQLNASPFLCSRVRSRACRKCQQFELCSRVASEKASHPKKVRSADPPACVKHRLRALCCCPPIGSPAPIASKLPYNLNLESPRTRDCLFFPHTQHRPQRVLPAPKVHLRVRHTFVLFSFRLRLALTVNSCSVVFCSP